MFSFISECNRKPTWLDFFTYNLKRIYYLHTMKRFWDPASSGVASTGFWHIHISLRGRDVSTCRLGWATGLMPLENVLLYEVAGKHVRRKIYRHTCTQACRQTDIKVHTFSRLIIDLAGKFEKQAIMNSSDLIMIKCHLISSSTPFLWIWFDFYYVLRLVFH